MQNSLEGELSSLWEESLQQSIVGLKGMQGRDRNTKPQNMKGIAEKENVTGRERRTAVRMDECIFPARRGHAPSGTQG